MGERQNLSPLGADWSNDGHIFSHNRGMKGLDVIWDF